MTRPFLFLCLTAACADVHRATLDAPLPMDSPPTLEEPEVVDNSVDTPADAVDETEPVDGADALPATWSSQHDTPRLVSGTWLEAGFGGASVSLAPTSLDEYISAGHMDIALHTVSDSWMMLRLRLFGDLGHGAFAPGNTVYLSGSAPDGAAEGAVVTEGTAQGCSGPDMHAFDTDAMTDDVIIDVDVDTETGELVLTVDADFGSNGSMTGTLVFQ